jgi:dTDP-4-dehydrorhamnose reductase
MKLAWITGANGLIGNYLVQTVPAVKSGAAGSPSPSVQREGWRVRALTRADFDLLDFAAVKREFDRDQPQLVIHCAAVTDTTEAQARPDLARRVNVEVTRRLADLAARVQFIFFSTDLVFDGRRGNYVETDAMNPLQVYGETKAEAEEMVLQNPGHTVVRTSLNGGVSRAGNGFNEKLRRALQGAADMKLFTDEIRCPLPAIVTARAAWELADKQITGRLHVAGAEKLSRWQIGQLLVRRWPEIKTPIASGSTRDFPGPPRALDTSLNIAKVQKILSTPLPGLSEWLAANPNEPF